MDIMVIQVVSLNRTAFYLKFFFFLHHEGKVIQNFDHSLDYTEREFMCASCNPTSQFCVIGSYDRLRILSFSSRKESWEEGPSKDIPNLYTITGLSWRNDGSKLAVVRGERVGMKKELSERDARARERESVD